MTKASKQLLKSRSNSRAKRRALRRVDQEIYFIDLRARIARRHKNKHFQEPCISTLELIELHNQQSGKCYYTELEYDLHAKQTDPLRMSVDRINNSMGYTKDNTVLCCWFVNCAKNIWPLDQMKELWKSLPMD